MVEAPEVRRERETVSQTTAATVGFPLQSNSTCLSCLYTTLSFFSMQNLSELPEESLSGEPVCFLAL